MITLTAKMRIRGENPLPFTLGVSELGGVSLFGETIDEEVKFDRRNLISLESEVTDRSEIDKPIFGIISTGGSISFKDIYSRFLNYENAGLLTNGIEIKIFIENTIKKTIKQVGSYYTSDWDYDNDNRSVIVSFKDDLEDLQNEKYILYETETTTNENIGKSAYFIFKNLIYNNAVISNEAIDILNNTMIYDSYIKKDGNKWSALQKMCDLCGLHIYKDKFGRLNISCEED